MSYKWPDKMLILVKSEFIKQTNIQMYFGWKEMCSMHHLNTYQFFIENLEFAKTFDVSNAKFFAFMFKTRSVTS